MLNLPDLIQAVQTNCDISDANHAGDYTLCTYLLKMREFYRWEHEIPYFHQVPQHDLGEWLTAREQHWDEVESRALVPLPLANGAVDPFDGEAVNRELLPLGYVYSAGYGRFQKPLFFLGNLLERREHNGFTILRSSCEYAREIAAPPAMLQGKTIFVREESARRFVWEKYDEAHWHKPDSALHRAIEHYDFSERAAGLERMTADAIDIMMLHELGEGLVGESLGEQWHALLDGLARSRAELVARAARDHLADCRCTLPALIQRKSAASLHFYFANFDGVRKELFGDLATAYRQWRETQNWEALLKAVNDSYRRWLEIAQGFIAAYRTDPLQARTAMEQQLPAESCGLKRPNESPRSDDPQISRQ